MTDEIAPDIAESVKNPVDNISPSDFAVRRLGQKDETQEAVASEQIQETPESVVEEAETQEETEQLTQQVSEESTNNDLSQYNLDEMSEEDLRDLSDKLGSKAVARFGELTAKRKQAEEKLAELQKQLSENKDDILNKPKAIENNPYNSLKTVEELQDKSQELNDIITWAEETLFESDGYSADDVVTEVEGKEVTKAQVRKSLLQARKARDQFLPDQLNQVQKIETSKQVKEAFAQQAEEELSWMTGDDNDTRRNYEAMLNDKRFINLQETVDPDISAQLPYIIAHAANSIYGRKLIKDTKSVNLNPPKTGATSAPTVSRTKKSQKALADLNSRFKNSGSKGDFISLRTAQLSKQS
jgi:phage FluMu protein gp41